MTLRVDGGEEREKIDERSDRLIEGLGNGSD